MGDDEVQCTRAGIEMTKAQWFSLPLWLRQRYWQATEWGTKPAPQEMVDTIRAHLEPSPPDGPRQGSLF